MLLRVWRDCQSLFTYQALSGWWRRMTIKSMLSQCMAVLLPLFPAAIGTHAVVRIAKTDADQFFIIKAKPWLYYHFLLFSLFRVQTVEFASGEWFGIELDSACGKNNGSLKGKTYFTCDERRGMFARPNMVVVSLFNNIYAIRRYYIYTYLLPVASLLRSTFLFS